MKKSNWAIRKRSDWFVEVARAFVRFLENFLSTPSLKSNDRQIKWSTDFSSCSPVLRESMTDLLIWATVIGLLSPFCSKLKARRRLSLCRFEPRCSDRFQRDGTLDKRKDATLDWTNSDSSPFRRMYSEKRFRFRSSLISIDWERSISLRLNSTKALIRLIVRVLSFPFHLSAF